MNREEAFAHAADDFAEASESWVHDITQIFHSANPLEAVSSWVRDISLYICNDCESECALSDCLRFKVRTHETGKGENDVPDK